MHNKKLGEKDLPPDTILFSYSDLQRPQESFIILYSSCLYLLLFTIWYPGQSGFHSCLPTALFISTSALTSMLPDLVVISQSSFSFPLSAAFDTVVDSLTAGTLTSSLLLSLFSILCWFPSSLNIGMAQNPDLFSIFTHSLTNLILSCGF